MSDIRLEPNAESSDPDISHDSGIHIPSRIPRHLSNRDRVKRAAQQCVNEEHWKALNRQHLNSGIPAQTVSLVSDWELE